MKDEPTNYVRSTLDLRRGHEERARLSKVAYAYHDVHGAVPREQERACYGTLRYPLLRYPAVPYGTLRHLTVPHGTVRYLTVPHGTVRYPWGPLENRVFRRFLGLQRQ